MKPYEIREGRLLISDDKKLLDHQLIYAFLSERSYWARGIPAKLVDRSIRHSLCIGIYKGGRQVGFARAVTDFATFAWVADVFVVEKRRGHGLGKKLVAGMLAHPRLQGLRRVMLGTMDAHKLYERFGFAPIKQVERLMEMRLQNGYKSSC